MPAEIRDSTRRLLAATVWLLAGTGSAWGQVEDYDRPPIRYGTASEDNAVSRLNARLESGSVRLVSEESTGFLRALLKELDVPESSQMLVYSKTSFQRQRITPSSPRALYFKDEVYVGYCRGGDVLEVSAVDPTLGAVFYTLEQERNEPPRLTRQGDNCLLCHGSSSNQGIPAHLVRSLFVGPDGQPILSAGSYRTDHTSPLAKRWGGWYVTGTHGDMPHLGNLVIRGRERPDPDRIDNRQGMNLGTLEDRGLSHGATS